MASKKRKPTAKPAPKPSKALAPAAHQKAAVPAPLAAPVAAEATATHVNAAGEPIPASPCRAAVETGGAEAFRPTRALHRSVGCRARSCPATPMWFAHFVARAAASPESAAARAAFLLSDGYAAEVAACGSCGHGLPQSQLAPLFTNFVPDMDGVMNAGPSLPTSPQCHDGRDEGAAAAEDGSAPQAPQSSSVDGAGPDIAELRFGAQGPPPPQWWAPHSSWLPPHDAYIRSDDATRGRPSTTHAAAATPCGKGARTEPLSPEVVVSPESPASIGRPGRADVYRRAREEVRREALEAKDRLLSSTTSCGTHHGVRDVDGLCLGEGPSTLLKEDQERMVRERVASAHSTPLHTPLGGSVSSFAASSASRPLPPRNLSPSPPACPASEAAAARFYEARLRHLQAEADEEQQRQRQKARALEREVQQLTANREWFKAQLQQAQEGMRRAVGVARESEERVAELEDEVDTAKRDLARTEENLRVQFQLRQRRDAEFRDLGRACEEADDRAVALERRLEEERVIHRNTRQQISQRCKQALRQLDEARAHGASLLALALRGVAGEEETARRGVAAKHEAVLQGLRALEAAERAAV